MGYIFSHWWRLHFGLATNAPGAQNVLLERLRDLSFSCTELITYHKKMRRHNIWYAKWHLSDPKLCCYWWCLPKDFWSKTVYIAVHWMTADRKPWHHWCDASNDPCLIENLDITGKVCLQCWPNDAGIKWPFRYLDCKVLKEEEKDTRCIVQCCSGNCLRRDGWIFPENLCWEYLRVIYCVRPRCRFSMINTHRDSESI